MSHYHNALKMDKSTLEPPAPGETREAMTDTELEVQFTETFDGLRGEGSFDALGLSVQADILRTVTRLFPIRGTQRLCAAPTSEAARLAAEITTDADIWERWIATRADDDPRVDLDRLRDTVELMGAAARLLRGSL